MSNYYYMMAAVITILHSTCPVIPQDVVIFVKCFAPEFPHLRSSCMQTMHRGGESKRKKKRLANIAIAMRKMSDLLVSLITPPSCPVEYFPSVRVKQHIYILTVTIS